MVRYATTYTALNLLRCSGWELINEDGTPAFWTLNNLEGSNRGEILDQKLNVTLASSEESSIMQDFRADKAAFDFPGSVAGGVRPSIAAGYRATERILVPEAVPFTVSFDLELTLGAVEFRLDWFEGTSFTSSEWFSYNQPINTRAHFQFTSPTVVDSLQITFRRMTGTSLATFGLSKLMLAVGTFNNLPYTGDPIISCIPPGAIILSMGDSCPEGFAELGEGDLQPLGEWLAEEPAIKARKGNFPRGGTELFGQVLHKPDAVDIGDGNESNSSFETFDGYLATNFTREVGEAPTTGSNDIFHEGSPNPPADLPGPHSHDMTAEGTRPLSIAYRFCKRL